MASWRDAYAVHPAADVLPMLSPEELKELGRDIRRHGLKQKIVVAAIEGTPYLLDGRNRLDALEAAGVDVLGEDGRLDLRRFGMKQAESMQATQWGRGVQYVRPKDAGALIVSLNIRRRHLSPGERAELALKVIEAADSANIASGDAKTRRPRGRPRGKAARLAETAKVSKATAQRAIDKAEGKSKVVPIALPRTEADLNKVWHRLLSSLSAFFIEGAKAEERTEVEKPSLDAYAQLARIVYARLVERGIDAEYRALVEQETPTGEEPS